MCIIVAKNKGVVLPTKRTIKKCFEYNSDGAGLMYVDNGKVVIDKGYMSFGSFYKRIKELKTYFGSDLTDKALVFHFRIGTAGSNGIENCHPYPISDNVDDLHAVDIVTDLGIAHNGIISEYNPGENDKKLDMNDTQIFIRDYINGFRTVRQDFYLNSYIQKLILKESKHNKFAIMDGKENIIILGDFQQDNGVYYSNGTYKTGAYSYYNSHYDWYDDAYRYGYNSYIKKYYTNSKGEVKQLSYTEDDDYKICQYGRTDVDIDGNPYDDYDNGKLDFSTDNGWTLSDYLQDDSLRLLETYTSVYYMGGEGGYSALPSDNYYAIDKDNNIYTISMMWDKCTKDYEYQEGKLELYNQDYSPMTFFNFNAGDYIEY